MERSIFALFDTYDDAAKARKDLLDAGFSESAIEVSARKAGASRTGPAEGEGFFTRLKNFFMGEESEYYEEASRRGGTLLTVSAAEDRIDRAVEIVQRHKPVNLDQRMEEWRRAGWKGGAMKAPGATAARGERSETIPVVEEKLQVGKQREVRGGVRIYSRIKETPVQEEVTLREEQVDVERRRVDRPAGAEEIREKTVEMTEMHEEPVVRKEARVVEEIILRKDVKERAETVKDKVRRTEVEVEKLDRDFRQDFDKRFAGRGYTYEQTRNAYRYGLDLASDPRYRGKSWPEVEPEARRLFEERNPGKWNEFKEAVRSAFDRVHGRKAA